MYIIYIYVHVIDLCVMRLHKLLGRRASAMKSEKHSSTSPPPQQNPAVYPSRCCIVPFDSDGILDWLVRCPLSPTKETLLFQSRLLGILLHPPEARLDGTVHLVHSYCLVFSLLPLIMDVWLCLASGGMVEDAHLVMRECFRGLTVSHVDMNIIPDFCYR